MVINIMVHMVPIKAGENSAAARAMGLPHFGLSSRDIE